MKDRVVTIRRASDSLTFPANFVLAAALNPGPCGYFDNDCQGCTCSMSMVQRYQKRISGPLMDRIDIHLEVKRVPFQKLADVANGDPSTVIRQRVEAARQIQAARFAPLNKPHVLVNGDMGPAEVQIFCQPDETGTNLMRTAVQQMNLGARAYHRALKLAGSPLDAIADLAGTAQIETPRLAKALQYRPREIGEFMPFFHTLYGSRRRRDRGEGCEG